MIDDAVSFECKWNFLDTLSTEKSDISFLVEVQDTTGSPIIVIPAITDIIERVKCLDENTYKTLINFSFILHANKLDSILKKHDKVYFKVFCEHYGVQSESDFLKVTSEDSCIDLEVKYNIINKKLYGHHLYYDIHKNLYLKDLKQIDFHLVDISSSNEEIVFHVYNNQTNSNLIPHKFVIEDDTGSTVYLKDTKVIDRYFYALSFDTISFESICFHGTQLFLRHIDKNGTRTDVANKIQIKEKIIHSDYILNIQSSSNVVFQISHKNLISNCKEESLVNIKKLSWKSGILIIEGNSYIESVDATEKPKIELILKGREKSNRDVLIKLPVESRKNPNITKTRSKDKKDYLWSAYRARISISQLMKLETFQDGYWDLYITIQNGNKLRVKRLGRPTVKVTTSKNWSTFYPFTHKEKSIIPYFTPGKSLSILKRNQDSEENWKYPLKEKLALLIYPLAKYFLPNNLWLTWETESNTAQDNSYWLFDYYQKNPYHRLNLYYVIRRNSPDIVKFSTNTKNVIYFMSFKHLLYILKAKGLVSAQTRQHGYIFRSPKTPILTCIETKPFVFLQHGVTAFKALRGAQPALANDSSQKIDRFIVTSQFEKDIVCNILKYPKNNVPILGFTRFDNLKNPSQIKNQILLMPTWRDFLEFETNIVNSRFFKFYQDLISNRKLVKALENNKIVLKFYMHIKLAACLNDFKITSEVIKPIVLGEEDVSQLIKESKLMITDYSSVAWDFFYQKRPVVFAHFDEDCLPSHNVHYPEDSYLFGEKCSTAEQTAETVIRYIENDFAMDPKFVDLHSSFFHTVTGDHSKKTLEYIISEFK